MKDYFIEFGLLALYTIGLMLSIHFSSALLWVALCIIAAISLVAVYFSNTARQVKFFLYVFVLLGIGMPLVSLSMNVFFIVLYLIIFLLAILSFMFFAPRISKGRVMVVDKDLAIVAVTSSSFMGIPKGIYVAKLKRKVKKGDTVLLEVRYKWGERVVSILKKL